MNSGVLAITGDARQRVESSKWWQKGSGQTQTKRKRGKESIDRELYHGLSIY